MSAAKRFELLLVDIFAPILLAIAFFCVVVPVGLVMRVFGKTPLRLLFDSEAKSYWIEREQPAPAKDSMKSGF